MLPYKKLLLMTFGTILVYCNKQLLREKLVYVQLVKKFAEFCGTEISLRLLQESDTCLESN